MNFILLDLENLLLACRASTVVRSMGNGDMISALSAFLMDKLYR